MITRIDKETINFICQHKLTFQQYAICLLIYHKDVASILQISQEVGHIGECLIPIGNDSYTKEVELLVQRGYLLDHNKKGEYYLDSYILTEKFTDGFLIELYEAPEKLWNAYPDKLYINGKEEFSTKSCLYEDFASLYMRSINYKVKTHNLAMEEVEKLRKQGFANMGIMKWVGGRHWETSKRVETPKSRMY